MQLRKFGPFGQTSGYGLGLESSPGALALGLNQAFVKEEV